MPVQIGAKAHSFSNPTGLLSDCHRRIEMFLSTLEAVASVIEQPPRRRHCPSSRNRAALLSPSGAKARG